MIEVGFIVFLFYSNLLMGEFTHSGVGRNHGVVWAIGDIFTIGEFRDRDDRGADWIYRCGVFEEEILREEREEKTFLPQRHPSASLRARAVRRGGTEKASLN